MPDGCRERIKNISMCPAKGIWALIEHQEEKLQDGSLELVGEGRKIADRMNEELTAVTLGSIPGEQADLLAQYGAARILSLEHPALSQYSVETYSQILSHVIGNHLPDVVLSIDSVNGTDLACRIAARLETGLVTSCDRVDVDSEGLLVATKPVYGNKAAAAFICPTARPQMATINPDALELKTLDTSATAEVTNLKVEFELSEPQTQIVDFIKGDPRSVSLSEADIVIAGGMGFGSESNFKLVHELADVIGGSIGATRRAVDEEWVPLERQIGLTGKTVRPKLFIACGISGAIQHTMGMKDSRIIVAINTDRSAPIFKIADVSVVGDVLEVMPMLIERLREVLEQNLETNEAVNAFGDSAGG